MSQHTCLNCNVKFRDAEIQRDHYKTDWHRYNLKRRVADLPPITAEEFQKRVLQQRTADEMALQETTLYCNACRKQFTSDKSYDNHLNSKKHRENAHRFEKDNQGQPKDVLMKQVKSVDEVVIEDHNSDVEEVDSDEWDDDVENPIAKNDCIFCPAHSETFEDNVKHMSLEHTFFIPDTEFCVDIEGLLMYVGEKVSRGRSISAIGFGGFN